MTSYDLHSVAACGEYLQRLANWRENDKAQWGKLSAARAVVHCQMPLRVALGEVRLPRTFIGRLFGGMAKKSLSKPEPFRRGLPTDPRFLPAPSKSFDAERDALIDLVRRFSKAGPAGAPGDPHPFFGPLTPQEWSILMAKHLDHHLRQFGH